MLSQLSLKRKLLLFALVPVLVLSLLGCVRLFELLHNYRLANQSYHAVEVGRRLADLIYELQQERGLSAAYIACDGKCFADSLQVQQQRVSAQITALQNSPHLLQLPEQLSPTAQHLLQTKLEALRLGKQALENNRRELLSRDESDALNFYSDFNYELLLGIANLQSLSSNVQQARAYADLAALLRIQELAVRERGLINGMLLKRQFDTDSYEQLLALITEQDQSIDLFRASAIAEHKQRLQTMLQDNKSRALNNVREQLRQQDAITRQAHKFSSQLGYGGLLHEFKNFLLRGESRYQQGFYSKLESLEQILNKLSSNRMLSNTQQQAIAQIEDKLNEYRHKMQLIASMQSRGAKVKEIDSLVQISDEQMLDALKALTQPKPPVTPEVWWQLASERIRQMDAIADSISDDILNLSNAQRAQSLRLIALYLLSAAVTIGLLLFLGRALSHNLLRRIYAIANNMRLMTKDPNLDLDIKVEGKDELADMAKALGQMLNERQKSYQQLKQAAAVFDYSGEGIVITDANNRIELVNPAFSRITGYKLEEVKGKNPSILNSYRHDDAFFSNMWDSLLTNNKWEGEIWNKRKDGEIYPEYLAITLVRDDNNNILKHIGLFVDISHRKKYEQDIWYQAHFDILTKLPNRKMFNERLHHELLQARIHGHKLAILLIDLDRFKYINDVLGHKRGDLLLQQVARRLESLPDEQKFVARIGGDEFAVILPHYKNDAALTAVADRVKALFGNSFDIDGQDTLISVSFGIGVYPEDGDDIDALTRNTETAMYSAKDNGRDNYQYFTPSMNASMLERLQLEQHLRSAVLHQEFCLHYQPIVSMETGQITSVEALIRWNDPEYGWVSPEKFIPIAENNGLIEPIGEWVLEQALKDLSHWHAKGIKLDMAINVSSRQCINVSGVRFDTLLADAIKRHGIAAERLHIEITESMLLDDSPHCLEVLNSIRQLGVTIHMDDFGTGFSSLSYLRKFPISVIKIDKSFVDNALVNEADASLVRAIVMMGKSLDLQLVAEGIETRAQWILLKSMGCDFGQGYLLSRPLPAKSLTPILAQGETFIRQLLA